MGTSPKAVKIATLRAMPVNAATDSATRPLVESCRRAPTDVPALPRTPIRIARKATPRIARHAVNAAPPRGGRERDRGEGPPGGPPPPPEAGPPRPPPGRQPAPAAPAPRTGGRG